MASNKLQCPHSTTTHIGYIENWAKSIKGDMEDNLLLLLKFHWILHLQHYLSHTLGLQVHRFVGCCEMS